MTRAGSTRRRVLPVGAAVLAGAAAIATFTSASGSLVADARYEHFVEPLQFLARHASVWDAERNLGEPAQYFSPATATFQAALGAVGADPWVIQRLTHTLLLSLAGIGTMLLVRRLHGDRWVGVASGFLYAFNPYTSQYLVPSGLFTAYALAPWLVLFAIRGAEGRDPWRWAAAFAVAVFGVGLLNTPAFVLASVPALVVMVVYLAWNRGSTWRCVAGWAWRAAVLTVAVSAAMLVVLGLASPKFRANLETTESALVPPRTSSASESWRGLGFWLSYIWVGGQPLRDQATAYFTNPAVIAASFAAPAVAGLAFVARHRRLTSALAVLAGLSVFLMVGIHPIDDPSPFGRGLRWLFDESTAARGFRSTYKVGAGLQLAVAALAASAAVGVVRAARRRRDRWSAAGGAVVGVLVGAALLVGAYPFWTGHLYDGDEQFGEVPAYWEDALEWFARQPQEPGVLVLPSVSRSRYRWGFVNDGLFEAHLGQPAVAPQTLPQSTPVLADLTETIDEYLRAGDYRRGSLAPILDRMGVRWVLVQNDLAWERSGAPRPSTFDSIRDDADFVRVAAFGEAGENVVPPTGLAPRFDGERQLPPVEVYEVATPREPGTGVAATGRLMTGGGEGWPALAADGLLDEPIVYTAQLDDDALLAEAAVSAGLVISDGGQRRAAQGVDQAAVYSHVLSGSETTDRPARPLFPDPDDQTIVTYADLALVEANAYGSLFERWNTQFRPANAVDVVPETAWATDRNSGMPTLNLVLARPVDIRSLVVTTFEENADAAAVTGLELRATSELGDPPALSFDPEAETEDRTRLEVPYAVSSATSLTIELVVDGPGRGSLVGLAEVEIRTATGALDTREFLRAPAPTDDPDVLERLGGLPVHVRFTRSPGGGPGAEQAHIWRDFWSPERADLAVRADVRIDDRTPDRVIDALLGAELGAVATSRYQEQIEGSASGMLDDDVETAWLVDPDDPGEVTVRLGGEMVDQIELQATIVGQVPLRNSRISELEIEVTGSGGSQTYPVTLPDEPVCDPAMQVADERLCFEPIVVDVEPVAADSVTVRPIRVDQIEGPFGAEAARIATFQARFEGRDLVDRAATAADAGCRTIFRLDAQPIGMRPVEQLSVAALREGLAYESCEPVDLEAGWHRFATIGVYPFAVSTVAIDDVVPAEPSRSRPVEIDRVSQSHRRLSVDVEPGDLIVTDAAAHEGWQVTSRGVEGRATVADGFVAWRAAGAGPVELDVRFGPQRTYRMAWLVSSVTLAVCVWLLLPRRRTL